MREERRKASKREEKREKVTCSTMEKLRGSNLFKEERILKP